MTDLHTRCSSCHEEKAKLWKVGKGQLCEVCFDRVKATVAITKASRELVRIVQARAHSFKPDLEVVLFVLHNKDLRKCVTPHGKYEVGSEAWYYPPHSMNGDRKVKGRLVYGEWSDGELEKP